MSPGDQVVVEERREKSAQFHWAEANKFALEFCKSLFLFNTGLAAALLAFLGSSHKNPASAVSPGLRCSIFLFFLAGALAALSFSVGYLVNLFHGNSYRAATHAEYSQAWKRANRAQVYVYILFFAVAVTMGFGFFMLYQSFLA